ncbi:MAG: RNA ligase family protein [Planctomycetota bacterium]|nr:RNA ligase family protein [Planctomycetota bacterium]
MPEFYPYPRTPHLTGSEVADDDRTISEAEFYAMARGRHIVIQEKMDGTNVGVHFEAQGAIVLQKRSGLLGTGEHAQYNAFRSWAFEHLDVLYEIVGTGYVLFGEWLWAEHGMHYDTLPDFFLGFDLLAKESLEFLATDQMAARCRGLVQVVPVLWSGPSDAMPALPGLANVSRFAPHPAEGVYVRVEDGGKVIGRCKWRRPGFACGRADFATSLRRNRMQR